MKGSMIAEMIAKAFYSSYEDQYQYGSESVCVCVLACICAKCIQPCVEGFFCALCLGYLFEKRKD